MMVPFAKLKERSFILLELEIPAAYSDRNGHWQLEYGMKPRWRRGPAGEKVQGG